MEHGRARRRKRLIASTALAVVLSAMAPTILADLGADALIPPAHAESCCFTGGTRVLMADGSERLIGRIAVGDRVMGQNGTANTVTGIERVRLGGRRLYGINDETPFFTEEHPFLTATGWKSVSPAATLAETPALAVADLQVGDLLVCCDMGPAVHGTSALAVALNRRLVAVARLWSQEASPELALFNLLLDGDHTYVANGFVVHNKGGEGGDGGDGGSGGEGGGSGGDSDGGEGGDSDGGESGDDGGSDGGESGDDGGESGDDGGESGDEGGESGDEGGESGEDGGESGSGSGGGSGGEGGFSGNAIPAGPDLTTEEERDAISRGWK